MNKYISLLKEQFIISVKRASEYKASFYSGILTEIAYLTTRVIFMIIIGSLGFVEGWQTKDYVLFFVIGNTFASLVGVFTWKNRAKYILTQGELSRLLYRPILPFFNYFSLMISTGFVFFLVDIIIVIGLLIYFKISLLYFFLAFLFLLLIVFLAVFWDLFLICIGFISFGLFHISRSYFSVVGNFSGYPAKMFGNKSVRFLLILTVEFWVSYHVLDMLNGDFSVISLPLILAIIFAIFILYILNLLLWKYAEKKNEGYI